MVDLASGVMPYAWSLTPQCRVTPNRLNLTNATVVFAKINSNSNISLHASVSKTKIIWLYTTPIIFISPVSDTGTLYNSNIARGMIEFYDDDSRKKSVSLLLTLDC